MKLTAYWDTPMRVLSLDVSIAPDTGDESGIELRLHCWQNCNKDRVRFTSDASLPFDATVVYDQQGETVAFDLLVTAGGSLARPVTVLATLDGSVTPIAFSGFTGSPVEGTLSLLSAPPTSTNA